MVGAGGVQQVTRDLAAPWCPSRRQSRVTAALPVTGALTTPIGAAAFRIRLTCRPAAILCLHVNLSPLARLVAFGRPYVVVAHGREVWGELKRVRLEALQAAVVIWSVSTFTDDRLIDHGIARRQLRRLQLGVDVGGTRTWAVRIHSPEILIIARLTEDTTYKGADSLIEAFPRLRCRIPRSKAPRRGLG